MVLKRGYTLVELIIAVTIVVVLAMMMVGALNPQSLIGKANDSRRKKDIKRIKVAFEEYYNDKDCYPKGYDFANFTCGSGDFAPWLPIWPCDPKKTHYLIYVEASGCPKWYKIATKLENLNDSDIPKVIPSKMGGEITNVTANYGVSSSNIMWNQIFSSNECKTPPTIDCFSLTPRCNNATTNKGERGCSGDNCYLGNKNPDRDNCLEECKVSCCGNGCI